MSNHKLLPKIASEDYCCVYAYLRLGLARGETRHQMARFLNVSPWAIKWNIRQMREGRNICQSYSNCMKPQIEAVENLIQEDKKKADKEPQF